VDYIRGGCEVHMFVFIVLYIHSLVIRLCLVITTIISGPISGRGGCQPFLYLATTTTTIGQLSLCFFFELLKVLLVCVWNIICVT